MTGMRAVLGSALISCVACHPSIAPRATSIRMRSGISATDMATPIAPSSALQTVKPRRCRRRVNMSRLAKQSSTINIFLACAACGLLLGLALNLLLPRVLHGPAATVSSFFFGSRLVFLIAPNVNRITDRQASRHRARIGVVHFTVPAGALTSVKTVVGIAAQLLNDGLPDGDLFRRRQAPRCLTLLAARRFKMNRDPPSFPADARRSGR